MTTTPNLDAVAADLQKSASAVLNTGTQAVGSGSDEATAAVASKREALKNVANIVKEQANKGIDSSKAYLGTVVEKVGTYAQEHADKYSTKLGGLQENFNRAVKVGGQTSGSAPDGTTDRALPADGGEELSFPFNIVAWCSSLCGGKGTAPPALATRDFSIDSVTGAAAALTKTFNDEVQSDTQQGQSASQSLKDQKSDAVGQVQQFFADKAASAQASASALGKSLAARVDAATSAAATQANTVQKTVETTVEDVQTSVAGATPST